MAVLPSPLYLAGVPLADIEDVPGKAAGGLKGGLTHKVGPLEIWQWGAATLGVIFAYLAYRNHAASSAGGPSSAPATATTLPAGGANPTDIGTTISGQLTDLTGQVGQLQQSVAGLNTATAPVAATTTTTTNGFSSDITSLYSQIGQSPDAAGAAFWQGKLNSGDTNVFNEFAASAPQGFVTQQYGTQLHRAPDAAGLAYWQGQIQSVGATKETAAFNKVVAGGSK